MVSPYKKNNMGSPYEDWVTFFLCGSATGKVGKESVAPKREQKKKKKKKKKKKMERKKKKDKKMK